MAPVFLPASGVDTAFHRDSGTNAVLTTAVNGRNAAQTSFRPRSAAGADIPAVIEGEENLRTMIWLTSPKWGYVLPWIPLGSTGQDPATVQVNYRVTRSLTMCRYYY